MPTVIHLGTGKRRWRVFWWRDGKKRSATFRDRRDATKHALLVESGQEAERCQTRTMLPAAEEFLADRGAVCSPATTESYKALLLPFVRRVGESVRVDRIRQSDIEAWRQARADSGVGHVSLGHGVKLLRMFFRWCVSHGWCSANPAAAVAIPKRQRTIPHCATDDEVSRLLTELSADDRELYTVAVIMARAGLRGGEVRRLKWDGYRPDDGVLLLAGGKSGQRRIALHPDVRAALDAWPRTESPDIFPPLRTRGGLPNASGCVVGTQAKRLGRWLHAHGYSFTPHSLRHHFGSAMGEAGASLAEIMRQMGHTSTQVAMHYQHAREERLRAMVAAIPSALPSCLKAPSAAKRRKPSRRAGSGRTAARRA